MPELSYYQKVDYFNNERDLFEIVLLRKNDLNLLYKIIKPQVEKHFMDLENNVKLIMYVQDYEMKDFANPLYRFQTSKGFLSDDDYNKALD